MQKKVTYPYFIITSHNFNYTIEQFGFHTVLKDLNPFEL